MILPDANLLIYAHNTDDPFHRASREWLESVMSGTETVALTWSALLAFIRLTTSRRVFTSPLSSNDAFDTVGDWLRLPVTAVVQPSQSHFSTLRNLLEPLGTAANLTSDAHLAAMAIEHGATLYSSDIDFSRFRGLSWVNPLI